MAKGNVLVIGNSGVGKSTLINAVFGEDVAPTSFGISGTSQELKIYERKEIGFRIIDSIGFEPTFFKERVAINAVKEWSKDCTKEGKEDTQINVIWFCVDGTSSKLFPKTIQSLLKATDMWKSVPIITVITKSYSKPDREKNIEMVKAAFKAVKGHGRNLHGEPIPVVAQTYEFDENQYVAPQGFEELIRKTDKGTRGRIRVV